MPASTWVCWLVWLLGRVIPVLSHGGVYGDVGRRTTQEGGPHGLCFDEHARQFWCRRPRRGIAKLTGGTSARHQNTRSGAVVSWRHTSFGVKAVDRHHRLGKKEGGQWDAMLLLMPRSMQSQLGARVEPARPTLLPWARRVRRADSFGCHGSSGTMFAHAGQSHFKKPPRGSVDALSWRAK